MNVRTEIYRTSCRVEICRLEFDNRFDTAVLEELRHQIERIENDPAVRTVVLTGQGNIFCGGGDPEKHRAGRAEFAAAYRALVVAAAASTKPIIAAVNGRCAAGGMSLLEIADMAYAVERAEFGFPELAVGGFPLLAMAVVPTHLPKKLFFDLAYRCRMLTSKEALNFGLINGVEPNIDELWKTVNGLVDELAMRNLAGLARGRRLFYSTLGQVDERAFEHAGRALLEAAKI